jgi:hypothetical protein
MPMMAPLRTGVFLALGVVAVVGMSMGLTPEAAEEPPAFPALTKDAEPLRAAFNGDASHVRLLLFIDPT